MIPKKQKHCWQKPVTRMDLRLPCKPPPAPLAPTKKFPSCIAQDLENIGIKVNLEVIEENKLWELLETHDHPGMMFLGLGTYNLPIKELNTFYSTDIDNAGNYVSAEFDAAVDAMKVETDEAKRLELSIKPSKSSGTICPGFTCGVCPPSRVRATASNLPPYADGYIDIWQAKLTE